MLILQKLLGFFILEEVFEFFYWSVYFQFQLTLLIQISAIA